MPALAKPLSCPYNGCDSTDLEQIDSGASECAFSFPLDSNKKSGGYQCKTCGGKFILQYKFETYSEDIAIADISEFMDHKCGLTGVQIPPPRPFLHTGKIDVGISIAELLEKDIAFMGTNWVPDETVKDGYSQATVRTEKSPALFAMTFSVGAVLIARKSARRLFRYFIRR